jgi:hypothetical protein
LQDGEIAASGFKQPGQVARSADHQHGIIGRICQIVGHSDAAPRQSVRQPALESSRTGYAGDAGDQAQAARAHATAELT